MAEIRYKCRCMGKEQIIVVTDRVPKSDVVDWMENVVQSCVGYDHRAKSPYCKNQTTEYIKLPLPDDGGEIGVATIKN